MLFIFPVVFVFVYLCICSLFIERLPKYCKVLFQIFAGRFGRCSVLTERVAECCYLFFRLCRWLKQSSWVRLLLSIRKLCLLACESGVPVLCGWVM